MKKLQSIDLNTKYNNHTIDIYCEIRTSCVMTMFSFGSSILARPKSQIYELKSKFNFFYCLYTHHYLMKRMCLPRKTVAQKVINSLLSILFGHPTLSEHYNIIWFILIQYRDNSVFSTICQENGMLVSPRTTIHTRELVLLL